MTESKQSMSPHWQAERRRDSSPAPQVKTILVVDDYPSLCEVVAAILRSYGYHVLVAAGGEEACVVAREDETIDLLVTDIEMPQMCGDELADLFHVQRPATPILFMSIQARPQSIEPGHFLRKPFALQELISKVRGLLEPISALPAENSSPSNDAN
jgi:CheY-like chemotaxis protein